LDRVTQNGPMDNSGRRTRLKRDWFGANRPFAVSTAATCCASEWSLVCTAGEHVDATQRGPLSGLGLPAGRAQRLRLLPVDEGGRHFHRLPAVAGQASGSRVQSQRLRLAL